MCGTRQTRKTVKTMEPVEAVQPLESMEPVEILDAWNCGTGGTLGADGTLYGALGTRGTVCILAHQQTVVLLNVPLSINQQWEPWSLGNLVSHSSSLPIILEPCFLSHPFVVIILSSCLSFFHYHLFVLFHIIPSPCFPSSCLPSFCDPLFRSHHHLFILSPIIPSSCCPRASCLLVSCPPSSLCLVSDHPFVLSLSAFYLSSLCIPSYPIIQQQKALGLNLWKQSSRYNGLDPNSGYAPGSPSFCFPSSLHLVSLRVVSCLLPPSLHPQLQRALGLNLWKQGAGSPIIPSSRLSSSFLPSLSLYLVPHCLHPISQHPFMLSPCSHPFVSRNHPSKSFFFVYHRPFILSPFMLPRIGLSSPIYRLFPSRFPSFSSCPPLFCRCQSVFWPFAECDGRLFFDFAAVGLHSWVNLKIPTKKNNNPKNRWPTTISVRFFFWTPSLFQAVPPCSRGRRPSPCAASSLPAAPRCPRRRWDPLRKAQRSWWWRWWGGKHRWMCALEDVECFCHDFCPFLEKWDVVDESSKLSGLI